MTISKTCKNCQKEKPTEEFSIQKNAADKLHPFCKDCHRAKSQEYYKKNREKRIKQIREWQEKQKEIVV